jgi:hypothetical protein
MLEQKKEKQGFERPNRQAQFMASQFYDEQCCGPLKLMSWAAEDGLLAGYERSICQAHSCNGAVLGVSVRHKN